MQTFDGRQASSGISAMHFPRSSLKKGSKSTVGKTVAFSGYFVETTNNYLKPKQSTMHAYFRNHQSYLAEKCNWTDRQINKTSKQALLKIESYKSILLAGDDFDQIRLIKNLVKDSLLNPIKNKTLLQREGFYKYNLAN